MVTLSAALSLPSHREPPLFRAAGPSVKCGKLSFCQIARSIPLDISNYLRRPWQKKARSAKRKVANPVEFITLTRNRKLNLRTNFAKTRRKRNGGACGGRPGLWGWTVFFNATG
ncbi:hypothetical protein GWI33_011231 [Rhynchophorus ferrugineus]|uniref:Uncharacterized protein n=1 Tax=Rhynchophorus ferrugineus TaxID=354439 RepID=A0A834IB94_RHYFE|nr:hypothetical protein GWI33_011231 [Rhynchophorus ferrugineus]